ncbi:AraC family transcriptional regulator [Arundinibacter roseus]|uniref:Helix-turn-helix domain-containing protein n=1 Tax=Arundinibacter roseus TaxID=2070510 RepID=A0A4R4K6Y2_9BACT|nr:helix-turn-helix domain-containing protein [Arundinibacter roseus]TDB62346.1 helix-turn-helix domain-containing protein [Arundinibacter roseus]
MKNERGAELPVKDKILEKTIKIAPFKKQVRKTIPHKHNSYFEVIYLSAGSGFHTIDSVTYAVQPPMVFFVRKEQVHHWDLESEPEGFVLIIKKSFVDNSLDKQLPEVLAQSTAFACLSVSEQTAVEQLFQLMVQEYSPDENNNTPIMEGLLKVILSKLVQTGVPVSVQNRQKQSLFQEFQELLSTDKSLRNNVSYYAEQLHTTPQNLNAACRKAVGQSAAEALSKYIINEARRLLLYTNLSVSEIAGLLDFSDSSHFIKYYRRHTGQTPATFRLQG